MSRNYSRNTFLRQTPNRILKEYFARKGLLASVDFDTLGDTETEPIVQALDALEEGQRTEVEAEFRHVNEMACETGVKVLIEEAGSPFHNLDWSQAFAGMKNHYERALWAFLNDPKVFEIASDLVYMDQAGGWKQRYVGEGLTPAVEQQDKDNLATAICAFYAKQGRGRHCKVDNYRRENPERHCYFAYPEDHATTQIGYDDSGRFHHWRTRPAFEVIFVYQPQNGFLNVSVKGRADEIEELQEIFGQTILGLDQLPDKKAKHFDLEGLKNKEIRFPTDPADGVDTVCVRMLRLDVPGSGNRRVTFEASSPSDTKAIYKLIDRALAKQNLSLDDVIVAKTKLQFKFAGRDGKRGKSLTFEISTPDRCTLKDDPMDQIAKKYVEQWGLIRGWVSGTTGKTAPHS
ncbi:MAG: hypothetical protein GX448_20935 [Planctomycetes bacterium]|nr:hypothetical protein [Planctomycetota bacterium]